MSPVSWTILLAMDCFSVIELLILINQPLVDLQAYTEHQFTLYCVNHYQSVMRFAVSNVR